MVITHPFNFAAIILSESLTTGSLIAMSTGLGMYSTTPGFTGYSKSIRRLGWAFTSRRCGRSFLSINTSIPSSCVNSEMHALCLNNNHHAAKSWYILWCYFTTILKGGLRNLQHMYIRMHEMGVEEHHACMIEYTVP